MHTTICICVVCRILSSCTTFPFFICLNFVFSSSSASQTSRSYNRFYAITPGMLLDIILKCRQKKKCKTHLFVEVNIASIILYPTRTFKLFLFLFSFLFFFFYSFFFTNKYVQLMCTIWTSVITQNLTLNIAVVRWCSSIKVNWFLSDHIAISFAFKTF